LQFLFIYFYFLL